MKDIVRQDAWLVPNISSLLSGFACFAHVLKIAQQSDVKAFDLELTNGLNKVTYNGSGIAEGGEFQQYRLIELQMFDYFRLPNRYCQALLLAIRAVVCRFIV